MQGLEIISTMGILGLHGEMQINRNWHKVLEFRKMKKEQNIENGYIFVAEETKAKNLIYYITYAQKNWVENTKLHNKKATGIRNTSQHANSKINRKRNSEKRRKRTLQG